MSAFVIGVSIASALVTGCAIDPSTEGEDSSTEEIASSLSGDAKISIVAIDFYTGGDDKRSDSHIWVRINLKNGNFVFQEIDPGLGWGGWSWSGLRFIQLPSDTLNQDINDVTISWQQGGAWFWRDNWDLQTLSIWALDNTTGQWSFRGSPGGNPLLRFTGTTTQYTWGWVP